MEQKTDILYASAPLELIDLEQQLEKKLNDVNSFKNQTNNIQEMITYLKDKNIKSKTKYRKYEKLTTLPNRLIQLLLLPQHPVLLRWVLQESVW